MPSRRIPDELWTLVYDELRTLAATFLRNAGHTLQPTQLVHDAYLRLRSYPGAEGAEQGDLFLLVAKVMRHILVDHARKKQREKHGSGRLRLTIDGIEPSTPNEEIDLVAIDDALRKLEARGARYVQMLEARIFGGATMEQLAAQLGVSVPTARQEFRFALAYLHKELEGGAGA